LEGAGEKVKRLGSSNGKKANAAQSVMRKSVKTRAYRIGVGGGL